jgi:chromosome segregation ATPase
MSAKDPASEGENAAADVSSTEQSLEAGESQTGEEVQDALEVVEDAGKKDETLVEDVSENEDEQNPEGLEKDSVQLEKVEDEQEQAAEEAGQATQDLERETEGIAQMENDLDIVQEDTHEELGQGNQDAEALAEKISENPEQITDRDVDRARKMTKELREAGELSNEQFKILHGLTQHIGEAESEDEGIEKVEEYLTKELEKDEGLINHLEVDAEELNDEKMMEEVKNDAKKLEVLKRSLRSEFDMEEDVLDRLNQEIEHLEGEYEKAQELTEEEERVARKSELLAQRSEQQEENVPGEQRERLEEIKNIAKDTAGTLKDNIQNNRGKLSSIKDAIKENASKLSNLKGRHKSIEGEASKLTTSGRSAGSTVVSVVLILGAVIAAIAIL